MELNKLCKLGFGMMRLPEVDDCIDIEKTKQMIDAYMNAGMNYFDTAYMYHSGKSETVIKEVLVKRYPRDTYYLVDKFPIWMNKDKDEVFLDQLERCGVEYFDLYLLHGIEDGNIDAYEKTNCFEWGIQLKKEGKIKHFGMSYHGSPEVLDRILTKHPEIEIVQIQLNYIDMDNPIIQSRGQHEVLLKHNLPILIMEPVKGGTLANVSSNIESIFKQSNPNASIASWALRYAASLENVVTVLSGMSTIEQLNDNISTFKEFKALDHEEYQVIEQVTEMMKKDKLIACTSCRYCIDGCPSNINIPEIFKALNAKKLSKNDWLSEDHYSMVTQNAKASSCIKCGMCESVCPQHLHIIEFLEEAVEVFEK